MTTLRTDPSRSTPPAIGIHPIMSSNRRPARQPVLVLDTDRDGADARRHALSRYGICWIAIVHSVADARRFIAAEPSAAAIITMRALDPEGIDLARGLHAAGRPCLLLVEPAYAEPVAASDVGPPVLPLACTPDCLFAALDRLGLGHAGS